MSQMEMSWGCHNYKGWTTRMKTDNILRRSKQRERFLELAIKMLTIAEERGLRLIMENPWSQQTYLKANFVSAPALVDNDRTKRGDYFKKPTAYWFINCEPKKGYFTPQQDKERKRILYSRSAPVAGICSEERSMISPDYARNFICDFILGKEQPEIFPTLFNQDNI